MKQYKYFWWFANPDSDNTETLNKLLDAGWFPERESRPSNPAAAGDGLTNFPGRYLLVLLSKDSQ